MASLGLVVLAKSWLSGWWEAIPSLIYNIWIFVALLLIPIPIVTPLPVSAQYIVPTTISALRLLHHKAQEERFADILAQQHKTQEGSYSWSNPLPLSKRKTRHCCKSWDTGRSCSVLWASSPTLL